MLQLLRALHLGILPLGGRLGLMTAPPAPVTHLLVVDAILGGQWRVLRGAVAPAVLPPGALCFPAPPPIVRGHPPPVLATPKQDYIMNAPPPRGGEVLILGPLALQ